MADKLKLRCPQCRKLLALPAAARGRKIRCPGCEHAFVVEAPSKTPSSQAPPTQAPSTKIPRAKKPASKKRPPERVRPEKKSARKRNVAEVSATTRRRKKPALDQDDYWDSEPAPASTNRLPPKQSKRKKKKVEQFGDGRRDREGSGMSTMGHVLLGVVLFLAGAAGAGSLILFSEPGYQRGRGKAFGFCAFLAFGGIGRIFTALGTYVDD